MSIFFSSKLELHVLWHLFLFENHITVEFRVKPMSILQSHSHIPGNTEVPFVSEHIFLKYSPVPHAFRGRPLGLSSVCRLSVFSTCCLNAPEPSTSSWFAV